MASTPTQLLDQSVRHAVYLERYKSSAVKDYAPFVDKLKRAIIAELNSDITSWNRARLRKKLRVINKTITNIASGIKGNFKEQIIGLADYEAGFEVRSLGNVVEGYDFDIPSDAQLRAAVYSQPLSVTGPYQGQLLAPFFDGWTKRNISRVDGAIRLGFANGKTTAQLVRDISGLMDVSAKDLNNIVRTGLAHTAQVARNEVWEKNDTVVSRIRISATLDEKTSSICRSLDGKTFPKNKGPRPPFHINCRTTTTAALDERYSFLSEGATRSSRDPVTGKVKRVSSKETYYSWLGRQPAGVQDSIIGKTRGKLLRNGGIGADRFAELQLGKNFEPLTLKEMRKLEPLAFEKAKI